MKPTFTALLCALALSACDDPAPQYYYPRYEPTDADIAAQRAEIKRLPVWRDAPADPAPTIIDNTIFVEPTCYVTRYGNCW